MAVRTAILNAVAASGEEGLAFQDLREAVRVRLSEDTLTNLGSLGWHVTTVKLELEVAGDIKRMARTTPQRLVVA
ncbi:MAG: hypothetical protein AAFZ01_05810 [Pseudomonadota bacterium]